jgi:hypothetical protein
MVEVTEYVLVDDAASFYNLGLRRMIEEPVTRMVEQEFSRICGHVYEIEVPVVTVECTSGANGLCGAFAVGRCADCRNAVCRQHGTYVDDRLLCDACRATIEQHRAARARQDAAEEAARAEIRRKAAALESDRARLQAEADQVAYYNLPLMSDQNWCDFLRSNEQMGGRTFDRPEFRGRRPGELSPNDLARILSTGGFPLRETSPGRKSLLGIRGLPEITLRGKAWVVDEVLREYEFRGVSKTHVWICLTPDGRLLQEHATHLSGSPYIDTGGPISWRPGVASLTKARQWLNPPQINHRYP